MDIGKDFYAFNSLIEYFKFDNQLPAAVIRGENALADYIQTVKPTLMEVNRKWTTYKITPLHLAALVGSLESVQLLIKVGAVPSLYEKDYAGNTPAHLAALRGRKDIVSRIQQFIKIGFSNFQFTPNQSFGTPDSLLKITNAPVCTQGVDVCLLLDWTNPDNKWASALSSDQFKVLTGRNYTDYAQVSPKLLFEDWLKGPRESRNLEESVKWDFSSKTQTICLTKDCYPYPKWTVRTRIVIFERELIYPIGGKMVDGTTNSYPDWIGDVNTAEQCNALGFLTEGFPITYVNTFAVEGNSKAQAVFALETLEEYQLLTYHSGATLSKFERRNEYYLDKLQAFCSTENLKRIASHAWNESDPHACAKILIPIDYILTTPGALFYLVATSHLSVDDITTFESITNLFETLKSGLFREFLATFRAKLKKIATYFNNDPRHKATFYRTFADFFVSYPACIPVMLILEISPAHWMKEYTIEGAQKYAMLLNNFLGKLKEIDKPENTDKVFLELSRLIAVLPYKTDFYVRLATLRYGETIGLKLKELADPLRKLESVLPPLPT